MKNSSNKSTTLLIIALSMLTAFAPLSVDMYLPSLPMLAKIYDVNEATIQLTLSSFLFGFAVAQLIHGPLSDRWGRKPVIFLGITIYIIASLGVIFSSKVEAMIFFRFFQAFGGSAGPVIARAIVRDTFSKDKSSQILSILFLVMSMAPLLAPLIGGQILYFFGWKYIFITLIIFSFICLILTFGIRESLPKTSRSKIGFFSILIIYKNLLLHKKFIGYTLCMSFGFSGMFAYISGSPFFIIDYLNFSPQLFGFFFFINVLFLIIGSTINALFVNKYGSEKMLFIGISLSAIFGIFIFLNILIYPKLNYTIIFFITLFMPSVTITGANATAAALNLFPKNIGSAAAAIGAVQFMIGGISGYVVGELYFFTFYSMAIVIGISGLLSFFSYIFILRRISLNFFSR
ncbi:MAG: Bcr/CflA family drug resistance efflux transporter [Rhodospirillaceae bacterium]|nr:Bcr/CflA family drug resistance efflux transporter [Rhodospirillaceae bacterium]|tara:strand:+ start:90447 stop:91655 length:1209 start_codon:yes stop_codon:yes gene_type:complete